MKQVKHIESNLPVKKSQMVWIHLSSSLHSDNMDGVGSSDGRRKWTRQVYSASKAESTVKSCDLKFNNARGYTVWCSWVLPSFFSLDIAICSNNEQAAVFYNNLHKVIFKGKIYLFESNLSTE